MTGTHSVKQKNVLMVLCQVGFQYLMKQGKSIHRTMLEKK